MISLANFVTAIIFGGIFYRLLSVIIWENVSVDWLGNARNYSLVSINSISEEGSVLVFKPQIIILLLKLGVIADNYFYFIGLYYNIDHG